MLAESEFLTIYEYFNGSEGSLTEFAFVLYVNNNCFLVNKFNGGGQLSDIIYTIIKI